MLLFILNLWLLVPNMFRQIALPSSGGNKIQMFKINNNIVYKFDLFHCIDNMHGDE
jgi:hypothetical protein